MVQRLPDVVASAATLQSGKFFARAENIYGGLLSCTMLALPRELDLDITGFTEVTDSTTHTLMNLVN